MVRDPNNIFLAARYGEVSELARLLKEDPYLLEEHAGNGKTPLVAAIEAGKLENIRFLLDRGADVHVTFGFAKETPMHIATSKYIGQSIPYLLLENGAEIDPRSRGGMTPLHSSIIMNPRPEKLVGYLLDHGANINAVDDNNFSAIMFAAQRKDIKMVDLLMNRGASLDWVGNNEHMRILATDSAIRSLLESAYLSRGIGQMIASKQGGGRSALSARGRVRL